jgi:hypothetical protein
MSTYGEMSEDEKISHQIEIWHSGDLFGMTNEKRDIFCANKLNEYKEIKQRKKAEFQRQRQLLIDIGNLSAEEREQIKIKSDNNFTKNVVLRSSRSRYALNLSIVDPETTNNLITASLSSSNKRQKQS